jgi:hypothetical protein
VIDASTRRTLQRLSEQGHYRAYSGQTYIGDIRLNGSLYIATDTAGRACGSFKLLVHAVAALPEVAQ